MCDIKEEWRDIEGYEGFYQVSNLGRVRSLRSTRGRLLDVPNIRIATKDCSGYRTVKFSVNRREKTYKVHRLVAMAFIPNPKNKPQVNHIDGNKENNFVGNLEWVTASENMKHAFNTGLKSTAKGEKHTLAKLTDEQVVEIRKIYKRRDNKFGAEALSKLYGVSRSTITDVVLNKIYISKEYKFETTKKVTDKEVQEIRKIYNNKDKSFGVMALAKKFDVSPYVIRDIVKNKTYKDTEYKGLPMSKLSKEEADEIRKLYIPKSKQFNMYSLAKKYNVSVTLIYRTIHSEPNKNK